MARLTKSRGEVLCIINTSGESLNTFLFRAPGDLITRRHPPNPRHKPVRIDRWSIKENRTFIQGLINNSAWKVVKSSELGVIEAFEKILEAGEPPTMSGVDAVDSLIAQFDATITA